MADNSSGSSFVATLHRLKALSNDDLCAAREDLVEDIKRLEAVEVRDELKLSELWDGYWIANDEILSRMRRGEPFNVSHWKLEDFVQLLNSEEISP